MAKRSSSFSRKSGITSASNPRMPTPSSTIAAVASAPTRAPRASPGVA